MSQSVTFKCRYCANHCIKKGKRNGIQQYRCTSCRKYQLASYRNVSYQISDSFIVSCVKEGLGIRSMSRLLEIAPNTVIRRIRKIASQVVKPPIPIGKTFEVDEMITFVGQKKRQLCIVLALERQSKRVVDFYIGPRTQRSLRMVINTLLAGMARKTCTDGLLLYKGLIPEYIHTTKNHCTNGIERFNLNVRTHLKRLNRRSLAYSKAMDMLVACLLIYLWG